MKKDRILKLKEVSDILKHEFVGLDDIIDELCSSISPWYITPEIMERPQIVSLWGMTGTGKTSIIKRLIDLLELSSSTLFFDCGEDNNDNSISKKLCDFLGESDDVSTENKGKRLVFVFDEFQYARTLDRTGDELEKSSQRAIWNLIDSGVINLAKSSWDTSSYLIFIEDFRAFAELHPDIRTSNCIVNKREDVKTVLNELGLIYFNRGVPGILDEKGNNDLLDSEGEINLSKSSKDEEDDPYRPLRVVPDYILRILRKKITQKKNLTFFNDSLGSLLKAEKVSEISEILENLKQYIIAPKYIDCSDSLIFILGNLDEAYHNSRDINPDIDADVFFDSTSNVSVNDIKEALKKRFRAEQISRFGNNIIKYPSLSSSSFRTIIDNECNRLCDEFQNNFGISVRVEDDFKELLYFEGVYPVQGVRPVFTTISTILTPLFSRILISLEEKENKGDYSVKINLNGLTDFRKPVIKAFIEYSELMKESVSIKLSLGADRNPELRKTRVINSVHEAGHAIVMAYLTGSIPIQVVSVSVDHGGFCLTYDKERRSEIQSRQDVDNNVCTCLAGYEAEKLVFGESPEKLLCGSSNDITSAWEILSSEAYNGGYFEPYCYSAIINEGSPDGIPNGFNDTELSNRIKVRFSELTECTVKILEGNKELIFNMSKMLSEKGSITRNEIEELIKNNTSGSLNAARLDKAKKDNSYSWYLDKLNELLK